MCLYLFFCINKLDILKEGVNCSRIIGNVTFSKIFLSKKYNIWKSTIRKRTSNFERSFFYETVCENQEHKGKFGGNCP